MFKERFLAHKMPTRPEIIDELGSRLPDATEPQLQMIERSKEGFEGINAPTREMVVFVPEEDPEQILEHPVFGEILKPYHKSGALFAKRRNPVNREHDTSLRTDVLPVPVSDMGSIQVIHFVQGVSPEGDPEGTNGEFHVPRKMRSAASALKAVLGDIVHQGEEGIAIYLGGEVLEHDNAERVITALAKGTGNVTYNTDLYRTETTEQSTDGKLSDYEERMLMKAVEQGFEVNEDSSPEQNYGRLVQAISENPDQYDLSIETSTRSVRNAIKKVYLVADAEYMPEEDEILDSYKSGDLSSRVQSLCKFLAETPHNLLNCETFVRVLAKLNETVAEMGSNTEIEIFGPQIKGLTVNGSFDDFGRKLNVIKAVHQGAEELGPFVVRLKYRHPEAEGRPTHIVSGKSLMFDNGGNCNKGAHGESMQGDMMGGASVAAEFARVGETKPLANIDFVFGIAANKADGKARNMEDTFQHGSGRTTEETNTDAEGRQVMGDAIWLAMRRIREEGNKIGSLTNLATLTGAAVLMGGYRTLVMSSNKEVRRKLEDIGLANGDRVQPEAIMIEDHKATGHHSTHRADIKNVDASRLRGSQNAGAYIQDAANAQEVHYTHFDIAPAMGKHPTGTPKDVQGEFAADGYLDTLHEYLMWLTEEEQEERFAA